LSTRAGAPSEPLLSVVQDAYLAGVGTPRVEALVDALGSASLSTSEMGRIRAAPVAEVVAFRIRERLRGCGLDRRIGRHL
jgi:transposase-like protein